MKICSRCQKTYGDDRLNFCLDDGAALTQSNATDNSLPATVLLNPPRPTNPNPPFGNQSGGQQNNWNQNPSQNPNQFSIQPAKRSRGWLWALGILGGLILLCGGGLVGFVFWAASLENSNRTSNANYDHNISQKSPVPKDKTIAQQIDLSNWVQNDNESGTTEFTNGEFLMSSKKKGYYYVLASPALYKTENATTIVTVKNVNENSTRLGFGLVIHSSPIPLTRDYAFLIDSENKKYRVVRHSPGSEIPIVGWTRSSAIKDGTQENVLEVRDENKKMSFYINGEFIKTFDNTDGFEGGVTGIYSGDGAQIAFSDLEIRK
jgi:hypothetical protein